MNSRNSQQQLAQQLRTRQSRFSFMPADIVIPLIRHVLEEGRLLKKIPLQRVARHQWGEILAE
jgi:hypothetical protein